MLTHQEHQARAMLLGLHYDWRDGIYGKMDGHIVSTVGALDCLTCEPISKEEYVWRKNLGFLDSSYYLEPERDTPWGAMP